MHPKKKLGFQLISVGSCLCFIVSYLLLMLAMSLGSPHQQQKPLPKPAINFTLGYSRNGIVKKKRKYSKTYNKASLKKHEDAHSVDRIEKTKPLSDDELHLYLQAVAG